MHLQDTKQNVTYGNLLYDEVEKHSYIKNLFC